MIREPLPEGYQLHVDGVGDYIIGKLIGQGGFSLVYEAETFGRVAPVVIKEYFPAKGAERSDRDQRVYPQKGYEDGFLRNLEHFNNEGAIGGEIARYSFQTVSFTSCGNGYAIMREESKDMISIADLVANWSKNPPLPFTGNKNDADPVFIDLPRLKYSLRIVESLLSVLSTIHKHNFLHLDISNKNCLWADADQTTGRIGVAFIADFGCSVSFSNGIYLPDYQLSYSPGFAAPEVQKGLEQISPATDIYSVGMLLYYLCVGDAAFEITHDRKNQVKREISRLKIPQRFRDELIGIICTAVSDDMAVRFPPKDEMQPADRMQYEIRELSEKIPTHPINPDNTRSFTLFSLKSMLEGSLESHYSWAHELCDRRNVEFLTNNHSVFEPLTRKSFSGDVDFLSWVLPEELFDCLKAKIQTDINSHDAIIGVMAGTYPRKWKEEFVEVIQHYGTMRLMEISRTVLNNVALFSEYRKILFEILGEEGERLQDCYYNIHPANNRDSSYIGLSMLILYALLGLDGFDELFPSPSEDPTRLFGPI